MSTEKSLYAANLSNLDAMKVDDGAIDTKHGDVVDLKKVEGAFRKCDIPDNSRILKLYESKADDLIDHVFAIFET